MFALEVQFDKLRRHFWPVQTTLCYPNRIAIFSVGYTQTHWPLFYLFCLQVEAPLKIINSTTSPPFAHSMATFDVMLFFLFLLVTCLLSSLSVDSLPREWFDTLVTSLSFFFLFFGPILSYLSFLPTPLIYTSAIISFEPTIYNLHIPQTHIHATRLVIISYHITSLTHHSLISCSRCFRRLSFQAASLQQLHQQRCTELSRNVRGD